MVTVTNGFVTDGRNITATKVACKFIGDKKEVLTLTSGDISIGAEFEDVEKLIKRVRKERKNGKYERNV